MDQFGGFKSPSGFSGFGGFSSGGQPSGRLTTDQLLELARMNGGATAQIAEETVHPEVGILSSIGNKFKNAFTGFVDIISTPSHVVAGILDPNNTVKQAMEKNLEVSTLLLGDVPKDISFPRKVGSFATRFAIDVLTDPLTYVTFGATRGVLGLSKAPDILAPSSKVISSAQKRAKELGIKSTDEGYEQFIQDEIKIAIKEPKHLEYRALSQSGEMLKDWFTKAQMGGYSNLKSLTKKEIKDFAYNDLKTLSATTGVKYSSKEIKKYIKDFETKIDEQIKNIDSGIKLEDAATKRLVRNTLERKLDDEYIRESLSNLLIARPALLETYLDKGGIKFFGKTILSGQRLHDTFAALPLMSHLDNATKPTREFIGKAFNPDRRGIGGELPPEQLIRKEAELEAKKEAQGKAMLTEVIKVGKDLGLTKDEIESVTLALSERTMPADAKLAAVWKGINGFKIDEVNPALTKFAQYFRGKAKHNLSDAWGVGIAIPKLDNYVTRYLVEEQPKSSLKRLPVTTKLKMSKYAKIATFRQLDTTSEKEILKVGDPDVLKLHPTYRASAEQRIKDSLKEKLAKNEITLEQYQKQISTLVDEVNQIFSGKVTLKFKQMLKDLDIKNRENVNAFLDVLREAMPKVDVEKLTQKQLKETYREGVKIPKEIEDLSEEAVNALLSRFAEGAKKLPTEVKALNEALLAARPKLKLSKNKAGVEGELDDFYKALKESEIAKREAFISQKIDEGELARFTNTLLEQFMQNPSGVRRVLDSIIGRKQNIADILDEIQLDELAAREDLKNLPDNWQWFEDSDGVRFERLRASISEAESLGFKFDHNGLSILMKSSLATTNAVISKEYIDELAKYGVPASEAPEHYVTIAIKDLKEKQSMRFGDFVTSQKGEELLFPPEVAARAEKFMSSVINDESITDMMKKYDAVQNIFKASVTSIWPGFHSMNAISNVFLHFSNLGVHSLNPANHVMSAQLIANNFKYNNLLAKIKSGKALPTDIEDYNDLLQKTVFTDTHGYEWSFGELHKVLKENGVAFNPNMTGLADLSVSTKEMVEGAVEGIFPDTTKSGIAKRGAMAVNPLSQKFALYKVGRKVANVVEDQARILDFIVNLKQTGDVTHAAHMSKMFLFDYANLTPFEKTVMRRLLPFYTFTRKNLELQARTLLTTPGRTSAQIEAVQTIGDVISGGVQLTEEEKKALPEWMRNAINVPVSRKGDVLEIIKSFRTPIEQPFEAMQPNVFLASVSPLIRLLPEQITGVSVYYGKPLSEVTNATAFKDAPKILQDFIGFTKLTGETPEGRPFEYYVAMRPERMNLISNLPPFGRVISTMKTMETADLEESRKLMSFLFGFRVNALDIEQQAALREKELRKRLEELLIDAKVVAKFERVYVPKD